MAIDEKDFYRLVRAVERLDTDLKEKSRHPLNRIADTLDSIEKVLKNIALNLQDKV